jgi:hypothetical protein
MNFVHNRLVNKSVVSDQVGVLPHRGAEKSSFGLFYVKGNERVLMNPRNDDLHNIFQSMRSFD